MWKPRMRLNCLGPSPPDNDYPALMLPTKLREVDYREWAKEIENQTPLNSCTMNGNEPMLAYPINKVRGSGRVDLDAQEAYLDLIAKKYNGIDRGAYPRDSVHYLLKTGMLELSPHSGTRHFIRLYWRNKTIEEIENSLLVSGPVTVATRWFYRWRWNTDGLLQKKQTDRFVGYHQTCLMGVIQKDGLKVFVGRNSWGPEWGYRGYYYITPELLDEILTESYGAVYKATLNDMAKLAEDWMDT